MLSGFFCFAACDVQAKFLTDSLHPAQVVWFRQIGLALGVLVLIALRGPHILRSRLPGLQIMRGLTAVCSALCFVLAVSFVPLADVVAVTFIAPFVVTVLGAVVLREPVGVRRWVAVGIGFVGMLIVIRPGMGVFHPAIGFAVAAAGFFSLRQVLSRSLSGTDSVMTTVAYTSLTAITVVSLTLPFVWRTPDGFGLWLIVAGLAVTAALGEILVIRALDIAQAVVVAPMHYSLIIWGTFYGYVVFSDLPDGWTLLGCGIIVASGLYTLHRERLAAKRGTD
ncbi:DMT family transporter [Mameliella alba]|nr:DMT family transporter [Mameliella alba]ODM50168.1 transporter [Ruegeria sp. PBVC088]OWV40652.1 EamA family transporter [Mameliella alba]OWV44167.1 EamA family transporter [Mameliella alba]OWV59447.1 EamA family transporter [Mameliella alba]